MAERKVPKLSEIKRLKFRPISQQEINKRVTKYLSNLEEEEKQQEAESWKPKKEVVGSCRCRGKIVLETTYTSEYNPKSGPLIVGPGSRGQFRRVEYVECSCEKCGLLYNPKILKSRKKK